MDSAWGLPGGCDGTEDWGDDILLDTGWKAGNECTRQIKRKKKKNK